MNLRRRSPEEVVDPPRLLDKGAGHPADQSASERRAAEILRRGGEPTPPSVQALLVVEQRVLSRSRASRRRLFVARLAWALGALLLASSGALAAWYSARHDGRAEESTGERRPREPRPVESRPAVEQKGDDATPRPPALEPAPSPAHPRHGAVRASPRPIALSSQADAARAASFGAEGALLARALRALREEKNPASALVTLDQYARTYPQGRLVHEAAVARLEALVMAGKRDQALLALDGASPALEPLGRSELVLRGELRATAGRLAAARDDFASAWSRGGKDELASRALLDLARMQQSLEDRPAAEQTLRRYLQEFPQGSGAEEARRALAP